MSILLVVGHIHNDADYVIYYVWELFDRRRTSAVDNTAIVAYLAYGMSQRKFTQTAILETIY